VRHLGVREVQRVGTTADATRAVEVHGGRSLAGGHGRRLTPGPCAWSGDLTGRGTHRRTAWPGNTTPYLTSEITPN
jgi:hypothetical protein